MLLQPVEFLPWAILGAGYMLAIRGKAWFVTGPIVAVVAVVGPLQFAAQVVHRAGAAAVPPNFPDLPMSEQVPQIPADEPGFFILNHYLFDLSVECPGGRIAPEDAMRVAQGYDLSLNRYKEVVHEDVKHRAPKEILAELARIENEIQRGMRELEEIV